MPLCTPQPPSPYLAVSELIKQWHGNSVRREIVMITLKHQYAATVMMKPESKPGLRAIRFTTEVPNAAIVAAARVYVRAESDAGRD
jgi:hypothetical protein